MVRIQVRHGVSDAVPGVSAEHHCLQPLRDNLIKSAHGVLVQV